MEANLFREADARVPPMMFDLNQLRCFIAVAEELHFGRAAERLNMTQPPLSRQIQILERILDVMLLERTSRSVRLTPAGASFLPEARRILRLAEGAALMTRRVAEGKSGSIRVGFTAASAYSHLPDLIAACLLQVPDIDLSLKEMVSSAQIAALGAGEIDAGLLRPPIPVGMERLRLAAEQLLAAVPERHPLAGRERLRLEDFADQAFIMYAPYEARYFHDLVAELFARDAFQPKYVQHLTQIHTILALVRSGIGMALVPEAAANLNVKGVVLRSLEQPLPRPVELFLVWRKDNDNPLLPVLAGLAREGTSGS